MRNWNLDEGWKFSYGVGGGLGALFGEQEESCTVNLPHDYMIGQEVDPDAPAGPAMGYYTGKVANYEKMVMIPKEWEGEQITLRFDGVMLNAAVSVNGAKAAMQHYGYAPFETDITQYVYCGKENRISLVINPSMQPNSRWYSGAGIFRSVELVHKPLLHIADHGIFGFTRSIEYRGDGTPAAAYLAVQVEVVNQTAKNQMAEVEVRLVRESDQEEVIRRSCVVQVNPNAGETAHLTLTVDDPVLWCAESPDLYRLYAKVKEQGIYKTHRIDVQEGTTDEDSVLFGIRTVTADVRHGLRVNGKTVKLKGGCLHHDNGILGAVSLYDAEYRKLSKLKEVGFNAVRTTHNPPSSAFLDACDRLGIYVFDEAFDCWGIFKQPGDYSVFFESDWKKDLTAFIRRDRSRACVVIWSTGNEITERGGLNNGYTLSARLAETVKGLDPSRPVSNGICSMWSGLDDMLTAEDIKKLQEQMKGENTGIQNADPGAADLSWERHTEAFTNGLDIVGYNYMEDKYLRDHEMYPERVILGSENYPKEIGYRWPLVEAHPYIIGDFTWTAYDYIGEAGIGKAVFVEEGDPRLSMGFFALSSHSSEFPWRLANDADFDINGNLLPQGAYRSVIWGSKKTHVYSYDPKNFGKIELISSWGFQSVEKNWNWKGQEGKPVAVSVYSNAEEVELFLNGVSMGKKNMAQEEAPDFPKCVMFHVTYEPGTVTAVSYTGGREISRDELVTAGEPSALRLTVEKREIPADGHSVSYINVEVVDDAGRVVPDEAVALKAELGTDSDAFLAGFGSGNPVTAENYTSGSFTTFRGRAAAVVRAGYRAGEAVLTVRAEGLGEVSAALALK